MMNDLVILLPAYNEEDNLRRLVERWDRLRMPIRKRYELSLKIVVINDGSKDRTEEIAKELEQEYDNFVLVNHERNKGLGEAVKTGFRYVLETCQDCKYTCLMDCDNTQNPKYILDMLEKVTGHNGAAADVVIASRYQKGAKVVGVAGYRLLTSEGAKVLFSTILNIKNVKDYTCGYRLYSREILESLYRKFSDDMVSESGFTCMVEILYKLKLVGARFEEIPFVLRYDQKAGDSKMKVVKTAFRSLTLAFRLRMIK